MARYYKSDLLPALKGEGSNELTPHYGRRGLRGFIQAQFKADFQPPGDGLAPITPL